MTQTRLLPRQLGGSDPGAARARGLSATVEDPLWFLTRQWQLGELSAGDGGSIVACSIESDELDLDRVRWGEGGAFEPLPAADLPLEAVVENGRDGAGVTEATREERLSSPSPAWDASAMTYRFAVGASAAGGTEIAAPDYDGGRLDWYHFTSSKIDPGGAFRARPEVMPSPVRFPGGPRQRWWEIEDSAVDLGAVTRPEVDPVTMLVLEYSLILSNDWYIVPLLQRAGTVRTLRAIKVIDTFGEATELAPHEPGPEGPRSFAMFSLGRLSAKHHLLVRTKEGALAGERLEEVVWKRDEDANLVWGVEQVRFDAAAGRGALTDTADGAEESGSPGAGEVPCYRILASPPRGFVPYAAVREKGGQIHYKRSAGADEAPQTALVRGTPVLREEVLPGAPLALEQHVEAVRRAPRGHEPGGYFLWLGRARSPGLLRRRFAWRADFLE